MKRNTYIECRWNGESLLTFKRPTNEIINRLRKLLSELKPKPFRKLKFLPHTLKDVTCKGNLGLIISYLKRVLQKDYKDNCDFLKKEKRGLNFEYIIANYYMQAKLEGLIEILTRLYKKDAGNILYGRYIQRISEETYLLWVDD